MVKWVTFLLCLCGFNFAGAQVTFQRQVDSLNGIFCLEQTDDGVFWLGTFLGKIIRVTPDGQWLSGYRLEKGDTSSARFIYDLKKTPEGGAWALFDRTNNNNALDDYLLLARMDGAGQPVWQTTVHYGDVLHWAHNRLAGDPQGNVYVVSASFSAPGSGENSRIIYVKVAPDGTVVWTKSFYNQGTNYSRAFKRLSDGSFLICGNGQLASQYGFTLRLSADGAVISSARYSRFLFKAFAEMPDGDWVFAATESGPLPQAAWVVRMHPDGKIVWAKQLDMPLALNWIPGLTLAPNGNVLIFNYETFKTALVPDMIALTPDGDFAWAKHYDACHNYGITNGIVTKDGGIANIRYRARGHLLLKTDSQGNCNSCPATSLTIPLSSGTDTPYPFEWLTENGTPSPPAATDFNPFTTTLRDFCETDQPVDGFYSVPASPCAGQPLVFAATGAEPADRYEWTFPSGTPASSSGTSAVAATVFVLPGTPVVSLVVKSGFCLDTFVNPLIVNASPQPFSLGPDTTICGVNAKITLHAGAAMATDWLWNDGLTDPVRAVLTTGQYSVMASIGACSRTDTVQVQILAGLTLDLPGDTVLCGSDTLWLDATTSGADRYQWNDGYLLPRRPITQYGFYVATAFRGACSASDFVAVGPFSRPPLLPIDTVLCKDELLKLSAGNSLAGQITWNGLPGSGTFEFAGEGWVRREVTYQQCYFADSVRVIRADCRDGFAVYAPNVFSPNGDGANDVFEIFGDGLEVLHLQIFDRWGNQIADIKDGTTARWDGYSQQRALAPGIYIWTATVRQRGRQGTLSGDILVVK